MNQSTGVSPCDSIKEAAVAWDKAQEVRKRDCNKLCACQRCADAVQGMTLVGGLPLKGGA